MGAEVLTLLMVGSMAGLLALGVPFAFAMGGLGIFFGLALMGPSVFSYVIFRMFDIMGSFSAITLPLFVFMANMISKSGIAEDLLATFYNWAGSVRGSLAAATVFACALIGAMVGTAGGDIIIVGLIALPYMLQQGYDKSLACGSVLAGGGLGVLIPPSILFIIYGLQSGTSIGELFMAGVVPGMLLAVLYATYILLRTRLQPHLAPTVRKEQMVRGFTANLVLVKTIFLPTLLIFSVLGSIYMGMATPSEAAGVGAVGAMVLAAVRRKLTWESLKSSMFETVRTIGMIFWIIFGATAFIGVFMFGGGGDFVSESIIGMDLGRWGTLIVIQAILFFLGMFLEPLSILIMTVPIVVPIVHALGFDLVWYGALFVINMQMAYMTPPFGPSLFYLKGVAPPEVSLGDIYRAVPPFVLIQALTLALVMAFPELALWLPRSMQ